MEISSISIYAAARNAMGRILPMEADRVSRAKAHVARSVDAGSASSLGTHANVSLAPRNGVGVLKIAAGVAIGILIAALVMAAIYWAIVHLL